VETWNQSETSLIRSHLTISKSHKMPQHCIARIWDMFIYFGRFMCLFIYWLFLCAYFMSTQYRIVLFTSMSVTLYSRVATICNTWFNYKERCMWSTYCIYFYHVSQNKLWLYLKQHQPGDLVVEALYSWDSNCKFKCYLNGFHTSDCYCCLQ
jgi:hypothetical protein